MPVLRGKVTKKPKGYSKKLRETKVTKTEVKQMIKKSLDDVIEDKQYDYDILLQPSNSTASSSGMVVMDTANQIPLGFGQTHVLNQGTGQAQRIANKVKMKSAKLSLSISANFADAALNATPQPQTVRLVIYYDKVNPTLSGLGGSAPSFAGGLTTFQDGNASQTMTGSHLDLIADYNHDRFKILWQKTIKVGFANYGGTFANVNAQSFSNNTHQMHHLVTVDYLKYLPKTCVFNDNSSQQTSRNVYFYVYPVNSANVSISSAVPPKPIACYCAVKLRYEDA